ncbi:MAG: hypothetical protein PHV20_09095 [Bacteroidales bacterium]|nr:hypothetical protein [Bacteroidales bacterium]
MSTPIILKHGGYQDLLSYKKSKIVYDGTVYFCGRFFRKYDRTIDQMVQAARSGKQNIYYYREFATYFIASLQLVIR